MTPSDLAARLLALPVWDQGATVPELVEALREEGVEVDRGNVRLAVVMDLGCRPAGGVRNGRFVWRLAPGGQG